MNDANSLGQRATSVAEKARLVTAAEVTAQPVRRDFYYAGHLRLIELVQQVEPSNKRPWFRGKDLHLGLFNAFCAFLVHTDLNGDLIRDIGAAGEGANETLSERDSAALFEFVDSILRSHYSGAEA